MQRPAPVRVLALVEGRRLLRHPATALALVAAAALLLVSDAEDDFLEYKLLVGAGFLPVATASLLMSWGAASRSRRDETDELLVSMPVTARTRGFAHILAVAAPTGAAVVVLSAAVVAVAAWRGLPTPVAPGELPVPGLDRVTPAWSGLLQGPVLVATAGIVGVALGRTAAPSSSVVVGAVVSLYVSLPAALWWSWGWERFLLPAADDLDASTLQVGDRTVLVVAGHVPAALGWHLVYLAGIAVVATAFVLGAGGSRRRLASSVLVGLAVVAIGVMGQRLAWAPAA